MAQSAETHAGFRVLAVLHQIVAAVAGGLPPAVHAASCDGGFTVVWQVSQNFCDVWHVRQYAMFFCASFPCSPAAKLLRRCEAGFVTAWQEAQNCCWWHMRQ